MTFYTVSDDRYFAGTVALLNSLRLTGNTDELVVLDAGLTSRQRARLTEHATVIPPPVESDPYRLKPYPHVLGAKGTVIIIDSDMIVTGSLEALIKEAKGGKVCMFADPEEGRWFAEWEDAFALKAPLRRSTYLNSGLVVLDTRADEIGRTVLRRWWEACQRIDGARAPHLDQPDQDALNALLMSEIPEGTVAARPRQQAPLAHALLEVVVQDKRTLRCTNGGRETFLLHYNWERLPKPWQRGAWVRVIRDAYVALLPRVLFGADVPLLMDAKDVPLWLRPTISGRLCLRALSAVNRPLFALARRFPRRIRERVKAVIQWVARMS